MEGKMSFAGFSLIAVVIAAVLAFVWGAGFYGVLSKPWMKAARITPTPGSNGMMPGPALLINSVVCELVMATVLSAFVGHVAGADPTLWNGVVVGFFAWLGFMATTMAVNHRYEGYGWDLTIIDGAHWLGVAVIMGAVIGWWN
jgi:hypothetical protein